MVVEVDDAAFEVVQHEHLAVDVAGKLGECLAFLVTKHVVASGLAFAFLHFDTVIGVLKIS